MHWIVLMPNWNVSWCAFGMNPSILSLSPESAVIILTTEFTPDSSTVFPTTSLVVKALETVSKDQLPSFFLFIKNLSYEVDVWKLLLLWKYAHGTEHHGRNFSVKWLKVFFRPRLFMLWMARCDTFIIKWLFVSWSEVKTDR